MARIGFIGTGHMTRTLVRHLAPKGHIITVTHRGRATSEGLVATFDTVTAASPEAVCEAADILFLCLRPEHARQGVADLRFREDQLIVSVMAGVSLAQLADWCAPATRITAMLPMELIERGGCPIAVWPPTPALASLFEPENQMINLPDEAALSACFAATALTSAVAELLDHGAGWLGDQIGQAQAQDFVGAVISGMLQVHASDPRRFAALRDSLATPGTLNLSMVEALRRLGLPDALHTELDALARRAAGQVDPS